MPLTIDCPRAPVDLARIVRTGGLALAVVVVYVLLEWASFIHEYKGLPMTPWNPGRGVVLAVMIVGGARYAAVLFVGDIAAEVIVLKTSLGWPAILSIAAVHSIGYGALAVVLRGPLQIDTALNRLRDVLVLLSAGIVGAAVVTFVLTAILVAEAQSDFREGLAAFVPIAVGDAIGMAVVTPLTLRLLRLSSGLVRVPIGLALEVSAYLLTGAIGLWALSFSGAEQTFFYLLFLPVVVAAARHGIDGACISLALMQSALAALLLFHGYDIQTFTQLQTLMLTLTVTGLIVGVVVSERQNSDRRIRLAEARIKEREQSLAHVSRFNLVGGMASALAHEINQPMTAARALARAAQHLLLTPASDLGRIRQNLENLIAQIDHASAVMRRMRDFLRRGRPRVSTIDVRAMLDEVLSLIRNTTAAKQIGLELKVPDDLPPVHGDIVQLEQVVLNLIQNSIDAIVTSGQIDGNIRLTAQALGEPQHLEIAVADNGPGIDDSVADHLFEPFTSSKEEGLGLGLSICSSIVEAHGGRILLHARAPRETEFRIILPVKHLEV
jgi:signal transduction histidine kinase